jgi:UMF1 family MFS transporter
VQSLSRSYFARLIPAERSAEFFGFYNMLGKFAAVLGPILMGVAASLTGNPRAAVVPIIGLFAAGAFIFHFVKEPEEPKTVDGGAGAC